jgi:hypothetical protein
MRGTSSPDENQLSSQKGLCSLEQVQVNFTLEQAMKAQKGCKGVALLFL